MIAVTAERPVIAAGMSHGFTNQGMPVGRKITK